MKWLCDFNHDHWVYHCLSTAPSGCLQYRTGVVGQVRILGYPQAPHLGNLGYSVCVRAEDRARGISVSSFPLGCTDCRAL